MRQFSVFDVRLDDMTFDELSARLLNMVEGSRPSLVVTPNPEFLLGARDDAEFRAILNASDLSIPDGAGLPFAVAAVTGNHGLHRYPGVDVLPMLVPMCRDRELTLVLLGSTDVFLAQVKQRFATLAVGVKILTLNPGCINAENPVLESKIIFALQAVGPCVIAVALGQGNGRNQGKQEKICAQIVEHVPNAKIVIGVGGTFDVLSGRIPRAPMLFRRFGFEWLWRIGVEPWRAQRICRAVILFPVLVAYDTIREGRFLSACRNVATELFFHFFSRQS